MAPPKVWVPPEPSVRSLAFPVTVTVPVSTEEAVVAFVPSSRAPTPLAPVPVREKFWA